MPGIFELLKVSFVRITSFFNFGYVALTVKQVAMHDQGTYTCIATNALGRAETVAQLRDAQ